MSIFRSPHNPIIEPKDVKPSRKDFEVIGVFNVDLFIPTFTHVFGEAKQAGMHALVSLFRLAKGKEGHSLPSSLRTLL